jgi:hypothetical protein
MNLQILRKGPGFLAAAAFTGLLLLATSVQAQVKTGRDAAPQKKEKKVKDLDDALAELENAHAEVDKAMKDIDWSKIEKEMKAAMQKMNTDMSKMKADMQQQMEEIDVQKIKADAQKALEGIDPAKIKVDMDAAMSKIDMEKVKKEMERIKATDFKKIEADLKNLKPELEKQMKEAHENIEKAKVEIKEYKNFVDGLEKDGLINKKEGYTIEIKKETLVINGKEQPAAVFNKYRAFLEKHANTTIKKNDNDFNIYKD